MSQTEFETELGEQGYSEKPLIASLLQTRDLCLSPRPRSLGFSGLNG